MKSTKAFLTVYPFPVQKAQADPGGHAQAKILYILQSRLICEIIFLSTGILILTFSSANYLTGTILTLGVTGKITVKRILSKELGMKRWKQRVLVYLKATFSHRFNPISTVQLL